MRKKTLYDWYQQRKESYANACIHHAEENDVAVWMHLLLWAEALWEIDHHREALPFGRISTPRQKEIQRLWQQRGLLERTNANLRSCYEIARTIPNGEAESVKLEAAGRIVRAMIGLNMDAIATVKERIPA